MEAAPQPSPLPLSFVALLADSPGAAAAAPASAPSAPLAQAPASAAEASGGGASYDEKYVRAGFEHALLSFWRSRGRADVPPCSMTWLRLALVPWDLWERVQRFGGYEEVCSRKLWRTVGSSFGPPDTCTTISYQTKLAYTNVLLPFELETGRMHAPPLAASVPWGKGGVAAGGGGAAPRAPRPKAKKPRVAHARGWASSDEASSGDEGAAFGSRRRRGGAGGASAGGGSPLSSSRSPSPAEEEWALCDACRKWRRLPRGVRGAALPERWTCERGTWGFRDASAGGAFTPLSCALAEPTSSGEAEVPPEEGAPDAVLWEGQHWIFAFATAEAAQRRTHGGASQPGSQPPQRQPRAAAGADGAESAPPPQPPPAAPAAAEQHQGNAAAVDGGDEGAMVIE